RRWCACRVWVGGGAQGRAAACERCPAGRGVAVRACPCGAGCAECDRGPACARRTGAIHLPRQAVLLVSLRMGGGRLVLVRLWHLYRCRPGRRLRLERLGRAATLPRRAGGAAVSLPARALIGARGLTTSSRGNPLALPRSRPP